MNMDLDIALEIAKLKELFDHVCEDILDIPKEAITIKKEDGTYGIFCAEEYFDQFSDYMMSLDGWKPIEDAEQIK